jgi:hypothetical protein
VSGFFVATEDFLDESDGLMVRAGITQVLPAAACYRRYPERFKPLERTGRMHGIYGVGRMAAGVSRAQTTRRPSWQISDYDGDYDEAWRLRR